MFSYQHFIWMGISVLMIGSLHFLYQKLDLPLNRFLLISSIVLFVLEMLTMLGHVQFLPYIAGQTSHEGEKAPFIEPNQFPFHLCAVQFIFAFITSEMKDVKKRKRLLSFMYPTCVFGAFMALLLSNVFEDVKPADAFINPLTYYFFMIHAYILFMGLYIARSKEVDFHFKDCFFGMIVMVVMGCFSLMVNSLFMVVNRDSNGKATEIVQGSNLFFTMDPPIGSIKLTELWQWYLYFFVLFVLIIIVFMLFYLPFFIRDRVALKKKGAEEKKDS